MEHLPNLPLESHQLSLLRAGVYLHFVLYLLFFFKQYIPHQTQTQRQCETVSVHTQDNGGAVLSFIAVFSGCVIGGGEAG